ncbi:ribonuclease HII [Nodosilinea sp. LEGE 07088]|uniref:ribonuclease HII n=1 Tax=Nodosilinea sp. LEGE 07088 TaxID=2777968 RepID=UPI0018820893|nr:ribonuclease HII [Nodosilinea sp. LEGE 07088]MBE9135970.1 ribonuclease HII [Nodosilinea sp. LEGE 07088]
MGLTAAPAARIAGIDEVGRGCLFGPVVSAAVVLSPQGCDQLADLGVTDSKRLSESRREGLVTPIQTLAIDYALGLATVHDIERLNILYASLLSMRRALGRLSEPPDLCLVDGNQPIPNLALPQRTVVQGDRKHIEIAAASILAKVWRDRLMARLDRRYPGYHLARNKGYGSAAHRLALQTLGPTAQHRRSFKGCR